ncbi:MAG: DUF2470 domain-containing protein [Alphaproteobacteria bacterium]|nr:DUF2470 domain-containing protein [Alphaproteobacteria bacterium]
MTKETSTDSPAATCRKLLRATDRAVLSTILAETGEPYGSLVLIAATPQGEPLLLLSDLADHTKNLKADSSVSLLLDGTDGLDNPLTGARASLQGRIEPYDDLLARTRYIRRHPSARLYASFKDFVLYRLIQDRAHLVAGFGRIHWTDDLLYDGECQDLAESEAEVLAHMNSDHLDAVGLYANRLLGLPGVGWFLTGIDPEGCDLRRGGQIARLNFTQPVLDSEGVRREFVRLVKLARAA